MRTTPLLVIAAALAGCGSWSKHDTLSTSMAITAGALVACDYGQTRYASDSGRWDRPGTTPGSVQRELNPVLGQTPSINALDAWLAVDEVAIAGTAVAPLPRWAKYVALGAVIAAESYLVVEHVPTAGVCGFR